MSARGRKKAEWEALFEEIKEACARIGVGVRETSRIRSRGALCTVRGKRVVIVNRTLAPDEKVDLMVRELRGDDFSGVFLLPHLRDLLE